MKKKNLYQLVKQSLKEVLQEQRRDRRLGPDDFFIDPKTGELTPKALVGAPTQGTTLADPIKTKDLGNFDFVNFVYIGSLFNRSCLSCVSYMYSGVTQHDRILFQMRVYRRDVYVCII